MGKFESVNSPYIGKVASTIAETTVERSCLAACIDHPALNTADVFYGSMKAMYGRFSDAAHVEDDAEEKVDER